MRGEFQIFAVASLGIAAACATIPMPGDPAVAVYAVAETEPVVTANEDAADDPAIWRNAASPADSLIVATDKKAGLYIYGLDGKVKSFSEHPALNNVDLVDMGEAGVIVFASDRSDLAHAKVVLYRLDTASGVLTELGRVATGAGEGYGICGTRRGDALIVYTAPKSGRIGEWEIALGDTPTARELRTMQVPSQPEGCVVDHRNGTLYIGEEAAGVSCRGRRLANWSPQSMAASSWPTSKG